MGGPKKGTIFPNRWVSGPDPIRHKQYRVWLQQRNQANFRGEVWLLDLEDWIRLWGEFWYSRGRGKDDYCMTRSDPNGAWELGNVEVVTRQEHLVRQRARQVALRNGKGYNGRRMA